MIRYVRYIGLGDVVSPEIGGHRSGGGHSPLVSVDAVVHESRFVHGAEVPAADSFHGGGSLGRGLTLVDELDRIRAEQIVEGPAVVDGLLKQVRIDQRLDESDGDVRRNGGDGSGRQRREVRPGVQAEEAEHARGIGWQSVVRPREHIAQCFALVVFVWKILVQQRLTGQQSSVERDERREGPGRGLLGRDAHGQGVATAEPCELGQSGFGIATAILGDRRSEQIDGLALG
jgi:hypothetical protein